MNNNTSIPDALETRTQKAGKRSPSAEIRKFNINWIENLTREGLAYGTKEKQLLIHTTKVGERIFIQYPGKESREYTQNGKERTETAIRPWDFRPELYLADNSRHKNMSFGDIWASVFETLSNLSKENTEKILRMFGTLLYRMAFMLDHTKVEAFDTIERDVIYKGNKQSEFSSERNLKLPPLYKYSPNEQVLEHIADTCPQWRNMSFEAFLYYNDLLGWNEDCKYYYRNFHVKNDEQWISSTGRVNTLCTHIRILGTILNDIELAAIFNDFANLRGVSPASNEEIIRICRDYVKIN